MLTFTSALNACSGANSQGSQIGKTAPQFILDDLNNKPVSLSSYLGKAVLMNFWTTSCPPCVEEMPYFQELYQDWSTRDDVSILMINIGEDIRRVENFMQSHNYTLPVLLDSQGKVAEAYQVQYTPTTVLIDQSGRLSYKAIGAFKNKLSIVKTVEGVLTR